jgi:hypothetical protein
LCKLQYKRMRPCAKDRKGLTDEVPCRLSSDFDWGHRFPSIVSRLPVSTRILNQTSPATSACWAVHKWSRCDATIN